MFSFQVAPKYVFELALMLPMHVLGRKSLVPTNVMCERKVSKLLGENYEHKQY